DQRIAVLLLENHGPGRGAEGIGDPQAAAQEQGLAPEQILAGLDRAASPVGHALHREPQGYRKTAREAPELGEVGVLVNRAEIEIHADVAQAFAELRREEEPGVGAD